MNSLIPLDMTIFFCSTVLPRVAWSLLTVPMSKELLFFSLQTDVVLASKNILIQNAKRKLAGCTTTMFLSARKEKTRFIVIPAGKPISILGGVCKGINSDGNEYMCINQRYNDASARTLYLPSLDIFARNSPDDVSEEKSNDEPSYRDTFSF
ncbi:hypothetical protein EV421DRAFT_1845693 [Armillaria borealis]|uniref:Uncharacterized protein n=1 Tax=Armillaria borealis TaxID=47425 RepID=A0AA39J2I0_9AGAR|nr:hypothetical protein EV421DRAFT_1845693 [Armillaria borealis]